MQFYIRYFLKSNVESLQIISDMLWTYSGLGPFANDLFIYSDA